MADRRDLSPLLSHLLWFAFTSKLRNVRNLHNYMTLIRREENPMGGTVLYGWLTQTFGLLLNKAKIINEDLSYYIPDQMLHSSTVRNTLLH